MIKVSVLRCETMKNPLGISVLHPRLSWNLETDERSVFQKAFRIQIWENQQESSDRTIVYDSGFIESDEMTFHLTAGILKSRKNYGWRVMIIDRYDRMFESEEDAWFEMGILSQEEWIAQWIEPEQKPVYICRIDSVRITDNDTVDEKKMRPCPLIRKEFVLNKPVRNARAYATAHGIYRLFLNGHRVGNYEFAPEPTCYDKLLQVQTYRITDLLQSGLNILGAVLADGWWAGRLGVYGESAQYGVTLGLLLQVEIEFTDGSFLRIGTDSSYRSSFGARRYADLMIGEKYDLNDRQDGWLSPGFDDKEWTNVKVSDTDLQNLTGQNAPHIRVIQEFDKWKSFITPKGEFIIDCGQIQSGNAAMHLRSAPGAEIQLSYFEELDQNGCYFKKYAGRNTVQRDVFVLDDSGEGDYDPWFSMKGFRYIRVTGNKGPVEVLDVKSRLIASDNEVVSELETSDDRINRLWKNIRWTLTSNIVGIPTDNPDRERSGYIGDFGMSIAASCYQFDMEAFARRFLSEISFEQYEDGSIPTIVPNWKTFRETMGAKTSSGWTDYAVIIPWILYQRYGDIHILQDNYAMMKKWVEYQKHRAESANPMETEEATQRDKEYSRYLWNTDTNFGDWLTPSISYDEKTRIYTYYTQTMCDMIGTYFYAYTTSVMQQAALVLGKEEESEYYGLLNRRIREAAIEMFYKKGKILESTLMGAKVLALHMGFCPDEGREKLVRQLIELANEKGVDTGFITTVSLPDILTQNGYPEVMYELLFREDYPSWLYQIRNGATGVWESMNAILPDATRTEVSFIQAALCSIGNWMMESMGGIAPALPGFKKICIHPYFTERLCSVSAAYRSRSGMISCHWETKAGKAKVEVHIPGNTTAKIYLPEAGNGIITESGKPIREAEGIKTLCQDGKDIVMEAVSGIYIFEYTRSI